MPHVSAIRRRRAARASACAALFAGLLVPLSVVAAELNLPAPSAPSRSRFT